MNGGTGWRAKPVLPFSRSPVPQAVVIQTAFLGDVILTLPLIIRLADEGKGVLFISSEIEEMLRTCNRLAVLRDGEKVNELDGEQTQESVMHAIAGGEAQ